MAAPIARRCAREWFCPSRYVLQIRRILRARWREKHFAMPGVRRSVYRYFQSEDQREKMPGASTESLTQECRREWKETVRNFCPTVGNNGRIRERGHASASHKIAQDFFGASAFLVVLCFRNCSCVAAQFEPEKGVFQRVQT